jgi:mono/diheme cytochrome c family protein
MKLAKLVLVATCLALLALACSDANTNTANTGTQPSPAASPSAAAPSPTPDQLAAAREYYADNCAICHKENGEGGLVKIEDKRLKVPALTKGHALGHTDAELAKQIANGGEGMPAFKEKLKPEEINNLVTYIRKQFQTGANAMPNQGAMSQPVPAERPKQ